MVLVMKEALRNQAVTGVVPPQLGEALIRDTYPSVQAFPAVATLGRTLIFSIVGAPLGWAIMIPFYFMKVLPFLARRYTLTNRRVVIRHGLKGVPGEQVALAEIDDVRVVTDANSKFFVAATLEIISKGEVKLTLRGTPEAEAFRISILSACKAWVPEKSRSQGVFIPAKS